MWSIQVALFASLLLITLAVPAEAGEAHGRYVSAHGVVAFWCSPDPHGIVPQGDPSDHRSAEDWLLSGEPECAAGDALNQATGEPQGFAYGLVPVTLPAGTTRFSFSLQDLGGGTPYVSFELGGITTAGCTTSLARTVAPLEQEASVLVSITTGLTPGGALCIGTTGTYQASWS